MTRLMTYFVWLLLVLVPAMPLFGAEHEEASMKDEKSDAAKDAARERAVAVAERNESFHELRLGDQHTEVHRDRLHDHRGDVAAFEPRLETIERAAIEWRFESRD